MLYLMMPTLHWDWSALVLAAVLLVISTVLGLAESAKTPETSDLELNGLQKGGPKGRLPGQKE